MQKQLTHGIDIVSDGELGRIGYGAYAEERLSAFDGEDAPKLRAAEGFRSAGSPRASNIGRAPSRFSGAPIRPVGITASACARTPNGLLARA